MTDFYVSSMSFIHGLIAYFTLHWKIIIYLNKNRLSKNCLTRPCFWDLVVPNAANITVYKLFCEYLFVEVNIYLHMHIYTAMWLHRDYQTSKVPMTICTHGILHYHITFIHSCQCIVFCYLNQYGVAFPCSSLDFLIMYSVEDFTYAFLCSKLCGLSK